jgi:hypothetical protein
VLRIVLPGVVSTADPVADIYFVAAADVCPVGVHVGVSAGVVHERVVSVDYDGIIAASTPSTIITPAPTPSGS